MNPAEHCHLLPEVDAWLSEPAELDEPDDELPPQTERNRPTVRPGKERR